MAIKYIVNLTDDERSRLHELTTKGKTSARKTKRAHILLLADEDKSDKAISNALHTGESTVHRIRERFVKGGLEYALNEHTRPGARRKLDGKQEAYLVATACTAPPEGRKCWTMQLLADKLVEMKTIDSISDETVRRTLKKMRSSPGLQSPGV